jgi:hypothetical protein
LIKDSMAPPYPPNQSRVFVLALFYSTLSLLSLK